MTVCVHHSDTLATLHISTILSGSKLCSRLYVAGLARLNLYIMSNQIYILHINVIYIK